MVVKDCTHTQTQTYINYYPGFSLPLLSCAAGKAYLAFCTDEERELLFAEFRESDDQETIWDLHIVEDPAYLADIRKKGHASHARQMHNRTPGKTSSIAAPVFMDGRLRACLALVYFDNSMKPATAGERYGPALEAASRRISAGLASR
jgi:IclR family mhp operon transcriptional activator